MRNREIYDRCIEVNEIIAKYRYLLEEHFNRLSKNFSQPEEMPSNKIEYTTRKYTQIYERVYEFTNDRLGTINYFQSTIVKMRESMASNKDLTLRDSIEAFRELCEKVNCTISLFQAMKGQNKGSIGLEIKLPELNDITEFKKYIDGLEFIFTKCPFCQSDDACLKLEAVENGSIWLIFGVACASVAVGSLLLNNIAAFIDKCIVIKSHRLTCKMQEQEIESAKIEQKEKEELLKNIRRLYKISVENAIRELQVSTECHIQDGDEMGRVEQSFEKMVKMLEQGLQIYASLNSPQEIKALFAPLEMHYLSMGKEVEKIEEKAEIDTE